MIRVEPDGDADFGTVCIGGAGVVEADAEAVTRELSAYDSVVVAVTEAMSEAGVRPPRGDATLDDVVDTDSLERLFADKMSGEPREGGTLAFDARGGTVVVTREAVHVFADLTDDEPSPKRKTP